MLGKVVWYDKSAGMGCIQDLEGKEWQFSDDMIDPIDDALKAKMKEGMVVHFEPTPSLDNATMRVSTAAPDQAESFKEQVKSMKANESKKVDKAKKLEESVLSEAIDIKAVVSKAPYDLKPFVESILEYAPPEQDTRDILDDDDIMHEIADSEVPAYTAEILKFYADDIHNLSYADDAIAEGLADTTDTLKILTAGIYFYNSQKIEEARQWLKDHLDSEEQPE